METYLARFTPNVSNVWRTDELYLKVKGNTLMDHETRFWIAQQVADTKNTANVQPLFKEAKQIAGKRPNTLISAPNFADAFKKRIFYNQQSKNAPYQTYPHSRRPQQRKDGKNEWRSPRP